MKRLFFLFLLIAPAAFSQERPASEYVVLKEKPQSFFMQTPTPKLEVDRNLIFTDKDRASRHYNAYFSRPVDLRERFRDCRYAYEPSAFDVVTSAVNHTIFPEVKW